MGEVWKVILKKIVKNYALKDFKSAIGFANKVAHIAERQEHHPNAYIHSYNKVKIELLTHKIGCLHKNDLIMASKIDKVRLEQSRLGASLLKRFFLAI